MDNLSVNLNRDVYYCVFSCAALFAVDLSRGSYYLPMYVVAAKSTQAKFWQGKSPRLFQNILIIMFVGQLVEMLGMFKGRVE